MNKNKMAIKSVKKLDILHQKNHNIDIVRHYSLTKVNINWYGISNLVKKLHTVSQKGQKVNIKNEFGNQDVYK